MSDWKRPATPAQKREPNGGPRVMQGKLDAREYRVAIAASVFNDSIVSNLLQGAVAAWSKHGGAAENLLVVHVPGAFELPVTVRQLTRSDDYDAIVALGCVIRGGTPHFEYVAGECARGLSQVSCDTGIPVSFGVLTVETLAQAQ